MVVQTRFFSCGLSISHAKQRPSAAPQCAARIRGDRPAPGGPRVRIPFPPAWSPLENRTVGNLHVSSIEFVLSPHRRCAGRRVVPFVGAKGDRLRPVAMRFDQRRRRQALGMTRSAGSSTRRRSSRCGSPSARGPWNTAALLCRVPCGRDGHRGRWSRHACHCRGARHENHARQLRPRARRLARAVFGRKLFGLARASNKVPSTEKWSLDNNPSSGGESTKSFLGVVGMGFYVGWLFLSGRGCCWLLRPLIVTAG